MPKEKIAWIDKGVVSNLYYDAINNFRWNQSPAEVFQRTTRLTQPQRINNDETGSNMAPALITNDFNFTSISDAV